MHNGGQIPALGFGTFKIDDGPVAVAAVSEALRSGYRHIDTASVYGNEIGVGMGIRESGIPREDIFLTSKVWNSDQAMTARSEPTKLLWSVWGQIISICISSNGPSR